ncbi:MAG: caspase family protein [Anaerolineae bacterium]|nr:caspase family protein [Anaerolineae bacterium]
MKVYALLVGINEYAVVRDLSGCVQDVQRMTEFLQARVIPPETAYPDDFLQIKTLTNAEATRSAIIEAFQTHLGQAGDGDVAFFYYSGHGSEENAPPEFWHLAPTRRNQTLVCHDSRSSSTAWDLADKELGYLISQLAQGKANLHTLVILDSCHSGSGTRDFSEDGGVRMETADLRERKLADYIVPADAVELVTGEQWYRPPEGKHILLAACRPDELAKERVIEHETRGVFSYHLLTALQSAGPNLTYRSLAKHVNALVRLMVSDQTPQLEAGLSEDQPFLGGTVQKTPLAYTARYDHKLTSWVIDGGTIHGIASQTKPETTTLALFPTLDAATTLDLTQAKGQARVTFVGPAESKIEGTYDGQPLDKRQTYQALVVGTPLSPLVVKFEGDEALLAPIRDDLATINQGVPSLLVKETITESESEAADLRLEALPAENLYRLSRVSDPNRFVVDTPFSDKAAQETVDCMEHMSRWLTTYKLANPHTKFKDDDVVMELYTVDASGDATLFDGGGELQLAYNAADEPPLIKIKIVNNYPDRELYCSLLNLTASYGIQAAPIQDNNNVINIPAGGGEAWVVGGESFPMIIPDEKWQAGVTEIKDLFKLIVSTTDFDAGLLEQSALMTTVRATGGVRGDEHGQEDTLSRLMARVGSRAANWGASAKVYSDWYTQDLVVSTMRPQMTRSLGAEDRVVLSNGIRLENKSQMTATVRLMSEPESERSIIGWSIPNWLRGDATQTAPFAMNATRALDDPGLSVLALEEVQNYDKVSQAEPLKLTVPVTLAQNEYVLPFGRDGDLYLPLGRVTNRAAGTEITLERMPDPEQTRSLTNSIRIYFQKVIADTFGLEPKYPRLVMAEQQNDKVVYSDDLQAIENRIKAVETKRILLYIHGIIGETQYMVPSAWDGPEGKRIADQYDLILAFDYENLATGIKETAEALREKLRAVGLGTGHGKTFHIFAHSMGGLVSRWLVEHLDGGNEMVQHLFLFGTPNGGSPWPKVQDYVFGLLTIGLNSLAPVTWPVSAATGLLAFIEKQDKMLDEMAVSSELLEDLAKGRDPNLPYTIFAGNTSIIEAAQQAVDGRPSVIERLLRKVNLHNVAGLAFFNAPNDVAVSVESILTVPDHRTPAPVKVEVACDHMTYFVPTGGLSVLHSVLNDDPLEV